MDRRAERIRASVQARGLRGPSTRGEFSICCPECINRVGKEDESYKLQANLAAYNRRTGETGPFFFCYRCNWKGSCDLSWLGEVEVSQAEPGEIPEWSQPPESFEVLTTASIALRPYVDYLKGRGVWEAAEHVGAGACTSGRYAGRVVIPAKRANGDWWGFSARTVVPGRWKDAPKYLYPRGMPKGDNVWGLDWVPRLKDKGHPIYICEGAFDSLALYPYSVACFGKGVSDAQLDLLAGLGRPVVVALDGDAHLDARAVATRLRLRGAQATWCHLPPGTDPGTLGWRIREHEVREEA